MIKKTTTFISTVILSFTGVLLGYVVSQLILGYMQLNLVTSLGTFSLIVIFATIYSLLVWEMRQGKSLKLQQERGIDREKPLRDSHYKTRLIEMLDGDVEEAERRFNKVKQEYDPDMPENFYWEKALSHLRREQAAWD